jgi:hypothetical protein
MFGSQFFVISALMKMYIEEGSFYHVVYETLVDLLQFIVKTAAFNAVSCHQGKSISTHIVQHAQLKVGSTYGLQIIFMNQVDVILSFSDNLGMHNSGLEIVDSRDQ